MRMGDDMEVAQAADESAAGRGYTLCDDAADTALIASGYDLLAARAALPAFPYQRPGFLQLESADELQASSDVHVRPIVVPRAASHLPWDAGYAEVVNAGKSRLNEDNAHAESGQLRHHGSWTAVPYHYFGLFDGHGGHGCATAAARHLHHLLHARLTEVVGFLVPPVRAGEARPEAPRRMPWEELSVRRLVTGALEAAFLDMDGWLGEQRGKWELSGGCTALVALLVLGRLFVANAGDSRAVLSRRTRCRPLSVDLTPETERQRIRQMAGGDGRLTGGQYTALEFHRRLTRHDIGTRVLHRAAHMTGWTYKTVTEQDLLPPIITGTGKLSRVCSTIGVSRGFGNHDLRALHSDTVLLKPFLLPQPEVRYVDLREEEVDGRDVLLLATDGLWDVLSSPAASQKVQDCLDAFSEDDTTLARYRYISVAQELAAAARGRPGQQWWVQEDGTPSSPDDVSVFVVPVLPAKRQHAAWLKWYQLEPADEADLVTPPMFTHLDKNGRLCYDPAYMFTRKRPPSWRAQRTTAGHADGTSTTTETTSTSAHSTKAHTTAANPTNTHATGTDTTSSHANETHTTSAHTTGAPTTNTHTAGTYTTSRHSIGTHTTSTHTSGTHTTSTHTTGSHTSGTLTTGTYSTGAHTTGTHTSGTASTHSTGTRPSSTYATRGAHNAGTHSTSTNLDATRGT